MTVHAGPYRLGRGLLDDSGLSGGAFAVLYEATDAEGHKLVGKIARPSDAGLSATESWRFDDDGRPVPVHIPAVAKRRRVGEESLVQELFQDDLEQILVSEAALLVWDAGRLLPLSYGVWQTPQKGRSIPVLVMERLEGRSIGSIPDILAVLDALAAAAERGTLPFHGDLKPEHVFIGESGEVRLCDPAPRLNDPDLRAFTPMYNPQSHEGPTADAAACATILRYVIRSGDVAWRWCSELLDHPQPPAWADSHTAAVSALRSELADPTAPPVGWVVPTLPDRYGRAGGFMPTQPTAPAGLQTTEPEFPRTLDPDRISTVGFQPIKPIGWGIKQSVTLLHPDEHANFIASTEPLAVHIDSDEYAASQLVLARREFPGFYEIAGGWLTLNSGHRAVWRTFSWTPTGGQPVTQLQAYVANDGTGYTATGTATTHLWPQYEASFHELVRTIEVCEPADVQTPRPPAPSGSTADVSRPSVPEIAASDERVPVTASHDTPASGGELGAEFARPNVTLADVAGLDDVKQHIDVRLMAPLRNPEMAAKFGKSPSGGLLMWGPPGCGKTYIARALAGSLDIDFCAIGMDEVLDMWIGSSERNLAAVFKAARAHAPAALFFDEVDALGGRRSRMGVHVVQRSLVSVLLTELDGATRDNTGVFTISATNLPWDVEPALRRPGRFDRTLFVPPPDLAARSGILAGRLTSVPISTDLDLPRIALIARGLSGADVGAIVDRAVDEAFTRSVEAGREIVVNQAHLEKAASSASSSILDWIQIATTAAEASNDTELYEPFLRWLDRRDRGR